VALEVALNNNKPFISLTVAVFSILCGTLGLAMVCFGTIAVPASYFAEDQINFLGGYDAQAAMTAGLAALVLGLLFAAVPVYLLLTMITRRSEEKVIDHYEAYTAEEEDGRAFY